jgi:2-polyprenyl-6-methoxyphenol hydroxylase-like FAD-dependent oxidoreductase
MALDILQRTPYAEPRARLPARTAQCCIVGAGPAGMVLALLLARQGVDVVLLEAHETFEREFRGDTVHPSTRDLLDQLGLMDGLRALPHTRGADFPVHLPDGRVPPPPGLRARYPETWSVRQAAFLDFLAGAARTSPTFRLEMGARVEELVEVDGVVRGVRYRTRQGKRELRAPLVVGADGRFSKVRQLAGLGLDASAQPVDVLWLHLPKLPSDPSRAYGLYPRDGQLLVVGDRGDRWQVGLLLPKGGYQALRRAGLDAVRRQVAFLAPWLGERTRALRDWRDTSLLVVEAGRARRWHRPGLLLIGDAAHVMSPVFGVGINYAVQDAVVAANELGPRLRLGTVRARDLAAVQRRREWPTRIMQTLQAQALARDLGLPLSPAARVCGWLLRVPPLARLQMRLILFAGLRPERFRHRASPVRHDRVAGATSGGSRASSRSSRLSSATVSTSYQAGEDQTLRPSCRARSSVWAYTSSVLQLIRSKMPRCGAAMPTR